MWLDDVVVPWNRVFLTEPSPEPVARWLFWHQLYCWLAKAEFTLGLALACTQAMGLAAHEPTHRLPARPDHRRADRAQLPDRHRARPGIHRRRLLLAQPRPSRRRQHRDAEGAAAHGGDPAHPAGLLAGRGADRPRSRRPGAGRRAGGVVRRRRLQRAAAGGPAAAGVGPCRLGARSSRACVRAARQRRRIRLARPAAPTASTATTSWPTPCCRASAWPMPEINLDSIRNAPLAARRPVEPDSASVDVGDGLLGAGGVAFVLQ